MKNYQQFQQSTNNIKTRPIKKYHKQILTPIHRNTSIVLFFLIIHQSGNEWIFQID